MVVAVDVTEENALQVAKELPHALDACGIVSKEPRELTPRPLARVEQHTAPARYLYESGRYCEA